MKKLLIVFVLVASAAGLVSPLQVSAQGTDPLSVAKAFVDAINAQNKDAYLALFADDAVVTNLTPGPGQPPQTFTGIEEIRTKLELSAAEVSNYQVAGDQVTAVAKISIPPLKQLGVDPAFLNVTWVVQNGKIKSFTQGLSPETLAQIQAATAKLPATGGEPFPNYLGWLALGGIAMIALGWALVRRSTRHA